MTLNKEECKHIMYPIVKFGLNKAGISNIPHTVVRYEPRFPQGIGIFYPFLIQ